MVAAIAAIGGPGSTVSLGNVGFAARNGRPIAVGAAATTGNQLPVRKVPKPAPSPMPSAEVKISDAGRKAFATVDVQSTSKPSFVATETAALARANGVAPVDVGMAGSVSHLGTRGGASGAASSEVTLSDRALVALILALLAEVRSSENASIVVQASQLIATI